MKKKVTIKEPVVKAILDERTAAAPFTISMSQPVDLAEHQRMMVDEEINESVQPRRLFGFMTPSALQKSAEADKKTDELLA